MVVAAAAPVVGGTVRPPAPVAETVTVLQRSNDKWAGSLGLFLLRLVSAAIMGVHGANKLLNLPAATETLQNTVLRLQRECMAASCQFQNLMSQAH